MIENNENFEVCRKCGGKCCKFMPCMLFPGEVKKMYGIKEFTYDNMLEILKKKEVIIDYWEGDICDDINYCSCDYKMDECECGFDEEPSVFPENFQ